MSQQMPTNVDNSYFSQERISVQHSLGRYKNSMEFSNKMININKNSWQSFQKVDIKINVIHQMSEIQEDSNNVNNDQKSGKNFMFYSPCYNQDFIQHVIRLPIDRNNLLNSVLFLLFNSG